MPEPEPAPDKVVRVTQLLVEQPPLCVTCISGKSGVLVGEIEPIVSCLDRTISVRRDMGQCRDCERWTLVYSVIAKSKPR